MKNNSTRIRHILKADRARVYRALIDANEVAIWMVPTDMTSTVHEYDNREGGYFRISLTYDSPNEIGKSSAHTDTYHGRFVRLVPNEKVVEVMEFETNDPTLRGEMQLTFTLTEVPGGTELVALHENLPSGLSFTDNEIGWQMSIDKLAMLVEAS